MKVLREGQCVNHGQYGIGIAVESNEERTTIDFYEHGVKKFVTRIFEAELVTTAPGRPPKPRAPRPSKAAKPKVA